MKTKTTSHRWPLSRARFNTLHAIAAAGLLLGGLGTTRSRADILYVSNGGSGNNTIEKLNSSGVGSVFNSSGDPFLYGLAFDSAGNLYAANYGASTIVKFTSGGVVSNFDGTAAHPLDLAFDSAGNLYVTSITNAYIYQITSAGVGSYFTFSGLNGPTGLAFDSAGNLYAANAVTNTIEKFTSIGGVLSNVGSVFASTGLNEPYGLAFDSAGNLYVANIGSNTIEKFTPGGVGSVFASTGLNSPSGLAFDSAGNLYAANNGNSTIEKFTLGGVGSVFASSGLDHPAFLAFTNDAGQPLKLPGGPVPVPEPSTWAMLAAGTASLLALRRRKPAGRV